MMKLLVTTYFFVFTSFIFAQEIGEDLGNVSEDLSSEQQLFGRVSPSVEGGAPPKVITMNYVTTLPYEINTQSNLSDIPNGKATVEKYEEIYFKLKFPIMLKKYTKLIGGVQYRYHEYNFKKPEELTHPLYQNLHNKHLNLLRFDLYFTHSLSKRKFLIIKNGYQLRGEYNSGAAPKTEFLNYSFSGVFGWKPKENLAWGIGTYYTYRPERHSIYPALYFNHWINDKVGIETVFPANASLRWRPYPQGIYSISYGLSGTRYLLDSQKEAFSNSPIAILRRTDIQAFFEVEHQIHDFIWFGFIAGYNWNFRFNVDDNNSVNSPVIFENTEEPVPFFQTSLFLTIPKALVKKKSESPSRN